MSGNEIIVDLSLINVGIFLFLYLLFSKFQANFPLDTWYGILLAAGIVGIVSYLLIIIYFTVAYLVMEDEKQETNQENVK